MLRDLGSTHWTSLEHFRHGPTFGFIHFPGGQNRMSRASTSVAVTSLLATGGWTAVPSEKLKLFENTAKLIDALLRDPRNWRRKGLGSQQNVFTVGFVLEAAHALILWLPAEYRRPDWESRCRVADRVLLRCVTEGYARIENYPPSAYMTQLAVRVLLLRQKIKPGEDLAEKIRSWAWTEIANQLALIASQSKLADLFELAYSILICVALSDVDSIEPERALLLRSGLAQFFQAQLPDGTWPRGRPRFPDLSVGGSGFSYDYELLVQLLEAEQLQALLLRYLPAFDRAARSLMHARLPLSDHRFAWTSGNYLQRAAPESWATASAYHFAHVLDRLLAHRIRQVVFAYLGERQPQISQWIEGKGRENFAADFWDCPLWNAGKRVSLREHLFEYFVHPLYIADRDLSGGIPLPQNVSMSAIFFGPPGTSKTKLAAVIAEFLGWPLLSIDPSHLFRYGADKMQAEADRVFRMLAAVERVVVLLDEFDEMGRDRQSATEMTSRLLTTLMLPKFTSINDNRRIVFIVATNYIDNFDVAIRRPGRFDLILQVMPPLAIEKIKHVDNQDLRKILNSCATEPKLGEMLSALTHSEFRTFLAKLNASATRAKVEKELLAAYTACTLKTRYDRAKRISANATWASVSRDQQVRIRLPQLTKVGAATTR